MTLIVEDGSARTDSQTYATADDLKAYAKLRGETVPSSVADCEVLLMKAMDYLEGLHYQGDMLRPITQALRWPRYGVLLEGWPIPSNEIPRQLINAQCALAIEAQSVDLLPTKDIDDPAGATVSQTVGPVTTVYSNSGTVRRTPAMAKADVHLRLLLRRSGLVAIRT